MTKLDLHNLARPEAFQTTTSIKVRARALEIAREITGRVLDVGCGNGLFLLAWNAAETAPRFNLGLDYDESAVREASQLFLDNGLEAGRFIVGDAFCMPFPDNYYDAVFCLNTLINLHPFSRIETLIKEMHRICRPGGKIIFDYRNAYNPYLQFKYILNSVTGRLTTHGHRWRTFQPAMGRLKLRILRRLAIASPIPFAPLGYMMVLEKET